jgi:hypothetical protein
VGYVTLDDRPSLGRELPQDYYPEAMAVASSLADTMKWARLILDEEEKVNPSLSWGPSGTPLENWSGQGLYIDPGVLTPNAVDAIKKIAVGLFNLEEAIKIFVAKATKENGIPPTEQGTTERSKSAYWDRDGMEYVRGNATKLLEKWKWFEFLRSTPSNWWDDTAKSYSDAAKDFGLDKAPDFDSIITALKWGIGIFVVVSVLNASKK